MTKAQGRRSQKNKGRYKDRFLITERNKKRREERRKRLANSPAAIRRREIRTAAELNRKARLSPAKG